VRSNGERENREIDVREERPWTRSVMNG